MAGSRGDLLTASASIRTDHILTVVLWKRIKRGKEVKRRKKIEIGKDTRRNNITPVGVYSRDHWVLIGWASAQTEKRRKSERSPSFAMSRSAVALWP